MDVIACAVIIIIACGADGGAAELTERSIVISISSKFNKAKNSILGK